MPAFHRIFNWSVLLLLLQGLCFGADITDAEITNLVTDQFGPIVAHDRVPGLYGTLNQAFSRLSEAQQELSGSHYLSINELKILDSPIENAFVITQKADGVHRLHNNVFLTTALLKKMFGVQGSASVPSSELKRGIIRIVGVLSHELAHPIEETDSEALKKSLGKSAASQAREIRADTEGAMIAVKAGYPADSVLQGLETLFSDVKSSPSSFQAMAATHPENNLRLVANGELLTAARYEEGASEPIYPESPKPVILKELATISENQKLWQFVQPKSVQETVNRILAVPELKKSDFYKKVEFNRLVLSLDQMVQRSGKSLSDSDLEAMSKLIQGLSDRNPARKFPKVAPRSEFASLFSKDTESEEFRSLPDHFTSLKTAPGYRDPQYEALIKKSISIKPFMPEVPPSSEMRKLVQWLSMDRIFEEYHEDLKQIAVNTTSRGSLGRYVYTGEIENDMPLEFKIRMANLFHSEVFPHLDEKERIKFALSGSKGKESVVFPTYENEPKFPGVLFERTRFLGDSRKSELQGLNRAVMQRFWDNRGFWGTLELSLVFENMDWPRIWATLGIDKRVGEAQLRAAVKQFTSGPEYVDFLKNLHEMTGSQRSGLSFALGELAKRRPALKWSPTSWLDSTMWPYLSGDKNPLLAGHQELKEIAQKCFGVVLLNDKGVGQEAFRKAYGFKLREKLQKIAQSRVVNASDVVDAHREVVEELGDRRAGLVELIDNLNQTKLQANSKAEVLKAIFLDEKADWLISPEFVKSRKVANVLKQNRLTSITALFEKYLEPSKVRKSGSEIFQAMGRFRDDLVSELKARMDGLSSEKAKARELVSFAEKFLDPLHGMGNFSGNSSEIRELKKDVSKLSDSISMGQDDSLRLFKALTGTGATSATDEFFRQKLSSFLNDPQGSRSTKFLKEMTERNRFLSSNLQAEAARKLLNGEIQSLEERGASTKDVERIVKRINGYVPQSSFKKDELLEEIAWKLDVKGTALQGLIEDEKSSNWRKANPLLVNMGSAISGPMSRMDEKNRFAFMEYLLNPEGKEMPLPVLKEIESKMMEEFFVTGKMTVEEAQEKARRAAYEFKYKIEAAVMDSTPTERIPLFDLILKSGDRALAARPDFPYNLTRKYLGYKPGSTEEKMLVAFLKVIPAHEKTVTLSYLLSQVGQDKSGVNSLFEVFQTVGIKFGQMSSVWKIFGDAIAKETAELKDKAKPMSKAKIEEILKGTLSSEELSKIKSLKKVIGSASLKTVVLVELKDGREVVALVQRPHAERQIKSNLDLSLKFLEQLKRDHVDVPSGLFNVMVEDLRSQLLDETKMTEEAEKIKQARAHFEKLNTEMKSQLKGYRFEVPDVVSDFKVRDNLLFLEKANGATWKELDPAIKSIVGEPIAESSLRTLFRKGWFDPDRHGGNVMVDAERKVIHPIDFGQAENYTQRAFWHEDDRDVLARFLKAISDQDADAIVRSAQKMTGQRLAPAKTRELIAKVRQVLHDAHGKEVSDRLIGVVSAFADSGLKLERKFSFGALKGLMMLQGENYVPADRFKGLMEQEIGHLMKSKAPLYVPELVDQGACVLRGLKLKFGQ